ncbi:hypothetical protein E4U43_001637 [Claviceps pusilla]|uniref:SHSP domain-containing protein n=1 Tax=Claviceps pusilla TaxID=123648 RepID=A0A9P7N874_9HYPO|nr:hypothetical protein E4U43_001637 [Claviceps pusilla]
MAFFPQAVYNQDQSSFTPLFRLLHDFDSYSQSQGNPKTGRPDNRTVSLPHWQPAFDVRETTDSYELYGELPGVNKEHVNIDFTEPQTLQIRGRSERNYMAATPHARQIEDSDDKTRKVARRVTVEDEDEEEWSAPETPKSTTVEVERPTAVQPKDHAKYWLSERKVGEFSRTFNFPTRVDQDGVRASFQDGILSIIVPKAKKHEARRILIS